MTLRPSEMAMAMAMGMGMGMGMGMVKRPAPGGKGAWWMVEQVLGP